MFGSIGMPEILILLVVVVLLFGVGKISGLGRDLGTSIREFRRAVKDEDAEAKKAQIAPPPPPQYAAPPQQAPYVPPPPQQPTSPPPADGKSSKIF